MIKRRLLLFCTLVAALVGGLILWRSLTITAEPFFRLVQGAKNNPEDANPVDEVSRVPILVKAYQHAAIAIDGAGSFYLLSTKRDTISKIPGVPASVAPEQRAKYVRAQQNIIHVLILDPQGQIERAVPLRRMDGRPVRGVCEFLAVNAAGDRWWTLRQARESLEDWKDRDEVEKRTVLLNAYDKQGTPLGEWQVPIDLAAETLVMAALQQEAYIVPQVMKAEKQSLVYQLGQPRPQPRPWPGLWVPAESLVTGSGQFWHLKHHESGNVEAYVTEGNKPSRLFASFAWQPKGYMPSFFWHDPQAGLFVFENLSEPEPRNTPPRKTREDGSKAVYRISADGVVHKLFETMDMVKTRPGMDVRTEQLLKADQQFVWMEVEYRRDNKLVEYQIVKVPYR